MDSNKNVGDGVSTKWGKLKWDTHIPPSEWFFKTSKMMGLREFCCGFTLIGTIKVKTPP